MKRYIGIFIVGVSFMALLFFGQKTYVNAKAYERSMSQLVAQMSAKKVVQRQLDTLAEQLSLGLYKNSSKEKFKVLKKEVESYRMKSLTYVKYALAPFVVILGSYFLFSLRLFTFVGALGGFIALIFGLLTPLMMVTIHKKVDYLGDVVLSFESKGILGSISKLFEGGDWVVAGVILLFSVVVPLIKICSLLFISLFMESRFAHSMVKFFKLIGKWSMVDVFVVATFLVYLTANKGDVSHAEVEVGLYFFLVYVLVSMLVSLSADRMLHQHKRLKGIEVS